MNDLPTALKNYGTALTDACRGLLWLLRCLLLPWTVDAAMMARAEEAERQSALLRIQLEAAVLEKELLAEVNESQRRWQLASTAAAMRIADMHGLTLPGDKRAER